MRPVHSISATAWAGSARRRVIVQTIRCDGSPAGRAPKTLSARRQGQVVVRAGESRRAVA
jgi:hypothetical protein